MYLSGLVATNLTSDPFAQAATMALQAIDGLIGCEHLSPCSRDINSNVGVDPWHSYKMICCIYGWNPFDAESNTGSYYAHRNKQVESQHLCSNEVAVQRIQRNAGTLCCSQHRRCRREQIM